MEHKASKPLPRRREHGWQPMVRMSSVLVRAILLALLMLAVGSVGTAMAESEPEVGIQITTGSEDFTPSFEGEANGTGNPVSVSIYTGSSTTGTPVETLSRGVNGGGGTWGPVSSSPLEDGTYTAVAREVNEKGENESAEVKEFTIRAGATVQTGPTSTQVNEGVTATFTASASGNPKPTVQWEVSENKGSSWSAISGAVSNLLRVEGTTSAENGYEYRAVFTNKTVGVHPATTSAATLTVYWPPVVVTNPVSTGVVAGETATFTASASGGNPTPPTVQWEVLKGATSKWTAVSGGTSDTLTVVGTTKSDNGYEYRADFSNGHYSVTSEPATLTVGEAPPAITGNPSSLSVLAGETALFTASATGVPTPTIQWEVSADSGSTWTAVPGATSGSMTVTGATLAESGDEYRAKYQNKFGTETTVAATLTVTAPAPAITPSAPVASFGWFPASPHTGEPVQLASSSTDSSSPITAVAWDLTGNGPFVAGGSVLTTSFSTPGAHVVRMRVTAANGLSSIATRTITVTVHPVILMAPFPIVRIAGNETSSGARLSLLTVQAPLGARITVTCRGHGCPTRSEMRVAVASELKRGTGIVVLAFKRFERSLKAGVVLDISVWKSGEVGKYTSFAIRLDKLPVRTDTCLNPANSKPMACPAT
jgi:hypothetical protein